MPEVGKRGAATGITWGYVNEVQSIVRQDGRITMGWSVVPFRMGINWYGPFSELGDSGAAIFDITGRVAGIVTSGTGLDEVTDVTYMTSMAWLQQDMRRHGYPVEIL